MRLLLDTHVLIALAREELSRLGASVTVVMAEPEMFCSRVRLACGKSQLRSALDRWIPVSTSMTCRIFLEAIGLNLLAIMHRHAVWSLDPEPATRDPFDRLLLAQCATEDMRLVTVDQALRGHPLAWSAARR